MEIKLNINIGSKTISLSQEEAVVLYNALKLIFENRDKEIPYTPYYPTPPYPVPSWQIPPERPYWEYPLYATNGTGTFDFGVNNNAIYL